MAWYYGTFSCGHEGRVNIIGPTKDRQRKAGVRFNNGLCEECWEKQKLEERERLKKEALERAVEMELPALTGTEKQVEWAMTLRQSLINKFDDIDITDMHYRMISHYSDEDIKMILHYILEHRTDASYYIDNRREPSFKIIEKEAPHALKSNEEKLQEEIEQELQMQVDIESTVYPEKKVSNAVVEISLDENKVIAKFERNKEFRVLIRSLGYRWSGDDWRRNMSATTGTSDDRAAELGNKLLNAGFPIRIYDEKVRSAAINGEYATEHKRWIDRIANEDKLGIRWYDGTDMYKVARSLPGSRWEKPYVTVSVDHYIEVEEFAELYDFKFTGGALKLIEKHKEAMTNALVISPATVNEHQVKDGLQEILKSGSEIIDDLKD